jgi:hypothetical protein
MRKTALAVLFFLPGICFAERAAAKNISGDYVEVRSASVFAGACHFNGEVVTTGRDALMAWNIRSGEWKGTRLDGLRAIAVVSSDANLAEDSAHRSELIIDGRASEAQAHALVDALKESYAASLGKVMAVRRSPIAFAHEGRSYRVRAGEIASISVESMPNDECCTMPSLVWYEPLVPLQKRKVGYTKDAHYGGGPVAAGWMRADENSAFYGTFAI